MKTFFLKPTFGLLGCLGLALLSTTAVAGQTIYQYREASGSTLLTNKKSNNSQLKIEKKTYYPDSNIHSYSNWGNTEAAVLPSYSRNKNAFDHYIRQAAQAHGVSEGLIKAVMHTESGFNTQARSPVGAQGLMQLMPATARRFNVSNAYDPQQNIFAGAKYLAWLMKRFNGNTQLALAGYNAGEGNVEKYGGIPPFRETQDYVRRVLSRFNNLYAGGLSISGTSPQGQMIAQGSSDSTHSSDARSHASSTVTAPQSNIKKNHTPKREIILASDGTYTDRAAGSYATANASASAKIFISY